ncbi:MAG: hypothetical protein EOM63_04320 [Clostridia bacterium]|nr:hypothetical protein [Clostridia bacterium]
MARKPRASRESVAYREEYAAVQQQAQSQPLRVVRPHAKRHMGVAQAQQLLCVALVLSIAGAILYSQMTLTRLTREVSQKESQVETLSSEYVSLKAQQDRTLSLSYIEQYAQNKLGMVKMDVNQIEYIEMANPDRIEVSRQNGSLHGAISGLVKSFNAILEYLG